MQHHDVIVVKSHSAMHTTQPGNLMDQLFTQQPENDNCTYQQPHQSSPHTSPANQSQAILLKQWLRMIDGLSPLEQDLEFLPVEEHRLMLSSESTSLLNHNMLTCFVRHSYLRHSNLGAVELCQVAKLNTWERSIQLVSPPQYVVIKVFEVDKAANTQENPMNEFTIHQRLGKCGNNNIMPLIACLASAGKLFAVYPYFPEGDLFQNLSSSDARFSERDIRKFMRNMLSAIKTCHDSFICHRDISLENFLVHNDGNSLVLIDFGLSTEMDSHDFSIPNHGPVGKIKYMAPELVVGKPCVVDGRKVDVWSLGITLFMLVTKTEPFHVALNVDNRFRAMITKRQMRSIFASWGVYLSNPLMALLEQMLSVDPAKRPTVQEIFAHPWMQEA